MASYITYLSSEYMAEKPTSYWFDGKGWLHAPTISEKFRSRQAAEKEAIRLSRIRGGLEYQISEVLDFGGKRIAYFAVARPEFQVWVAYIESISALTHLTNFT